MNRSYGDDLFSAEIDKRFTWRGFLLTCALVALCAVAVALVKIAAAPLEVVLWAGAVTVVAASVVGSLPFFSNQK